MIMMRPVAAPLYLSRVKGRQPTSWGVNPGRLGLGEVTTKQVTGAITSGVAAGASTAHVTGSAIAGSIAGGLAVVAPFTGPAAPFLMAAAAMVAPIASLFKGCGQTCTQATDIANQAEVALRQLRDAYLALPVHWRSAQVQTLSYMDQIFEQMRAACSNPALGAAGQRCISERLVRGGSAPWCPTGTGCDWISSLRDPVANDSAVQPDPGGSILDALTGGAGSASGLSGLVVPGLLLLGGLWLAGDN